MTSNFPRPSRPLVRGRRPLRRSLGRAALAPVTLPLAAVTLPLAGVPLAVLSAPTAVAATPAAARSAMPRPTAAPPADHFDPVSVTFVSLHQGWVLGAIPCSQSGQCLALRSTNNAGKTWSVSPLPATLLALVDRRISGVPQLQPGPGYFGVRFANPRDGWLFGGVQQGATFVPLLWATHNAGASWRRQPALPGMTEGIGPVMDVEAGGGRVYALLPGKKGAVLDSAPVHRNFWRPTGAGPMRWPAGGAQPTGSIVLQNGAGWVIEGNDRGVTGSARLVAGKWQAWAPPCAGVGNSYSVPAARDAQDLAAVCRMGGFASPLAPAAPPGARLGSNWLYLSADAGAHFVAGPQLASSATISFGPLAYPRPGEFLVSELSTTNKLLATFDGGRTWSPVYRGDVYYIGFTSPSQGVGLVEEAPQPGCSVNAPCGQRRTVMIMTFDGGRHWQQVSFGM